MNMIEILKRKTLRLIGLLLCLIPVMACYPILYFLGCSATVATLTTVLFSGVAYILLLTRIEPFLRKILPFARPKSWNESEAAGLRGHVTDYVVKGPSLYIGRSGLDVNVSMPRDAKGRGGNWVQI